MAFDRLETPESAPARETLDVVGKVTNGRAATGAREGSVRNA